MTQALSIPVAPRGLATAFEETETPVSFALGLRNRFISPAGGAEKRQGMSKIGSLPTDVDQLHEHVDNKTETATLLASGNGRIYAYDGAWWTLVYASGDTSSTYKSFQINNDLIFVNGTDRNLYTDDCANFYELKAIAHAGIAAASSDGDDVRDGNVTDWTKEDISIGDIVEYVNDGVKACITAISTAEVSHTNISVSAASMLGRSGDGWDPVDSPFRIIDTVELNTLPTTDPEYQDNVATAGTGTGQSVITVNGIDWEGRIRVGDYVRNVTRSAIAEVTAVATAVGVTGIVGQVAGDSLIFYKSAMPIAADGHVHYGRVYYIDADDKSKVRISGPNNPRDMTTDAGTLDAASLSFGALQPKGDTIQTIASYQRFLVLSGKRYTYMYEGTDPIADVSGMTADFNVVGMFPQGVMTPSGLATVGNDAVIISRDGIQSFSLGSDSSTLGRENLSEAIKNEISSQINSSSADDMIVFHYPTRSWVCVKVGSKMYVYNYTPFFGEGANSEERAFSGAKKGGSWSIFDGLFAEQTHYLVRQDKTLVSCRGKSVYECDVDAVYTDDGAKYTTLYQTAWVKGTGQRAQNVKVGKYIQPVFNAVNTTYRVQAEAPFVPESTDSFTSQDITRTGPIGVAVIGSYAIGGAGTGGINDRKYPLLWRGKEARFTITTDDDGGPDIINRLIVFFNVTGVR